MTQELWQEIELYLNNGVSVIAVREKGEEVNGRFREPKTPIGLWKEFQKNIINRQRLWDIMDGHQCAAPAIVCGQVSGNLELIDIDEKHNPGGSAIYLKEIRDIYPELFAKLRIHKTPSGGYHLIYRCEELLGDGNMKLAVAEGRKEAWIETRGEGGYAVAPPALNYTAIQNYPIPVLSLSERNCLINLAKCFDTRIKTEKTFTPTQKDNDFYDENPFDHFNNSAEAEALLTNYGWQVHSDTRQYIHFTRPDKVAGISASFIRDKRVFYIFTTSTIFEGNKGYMPATVLSMMEYGGDKKKTFHGLIERGYGRIKPNVEQRLAKASAIKGAPLPANISESAKEVYKAETVRYTETYPFGVFWSGDALAGYKISREKVYQVAGALGFVLMGDDQICHIDGYIVTKVTKRTFFDAVKGYIKEEDHRTQEDVCNAYEAFLQTSGKFTIERLPLLNDMLFLQSTKHVSYKFFKNCYLAITRGGYVKHKYKEIGERLIWADQIRQRDFVDGDPNTSVYADFISKAIVNVEHAFRCIGYLAHEYKDESMGYIIVLTEAVPNPKDGGGSGKNIFTSLFSGTTTHKDVAGSQIQLNEKFLQAWNGERIFSISDAPKRFDFSFLKNLSTGTGILKKLFKNEESIDPSSMPKLIVSTNYSFEVTDGGLRRRIIPIEFTNFFTLAGGVDSHYKMMFPADWSTEDWAGYDNYMVYCITEYLKDPKLSPPQLTEGGWIKQFDMNYGQMTHGFIIENINAWKNQVSVKIEEFNSAYKAFCIENGIQSKYQLSAIRMNEALEEYCSKHNVQFVASHPKKEMGVVFKCKMFTDKAPF